MQLQYFFTSFLLGTLLWGLGVSQTPTESPTVSPTQSPTVPPTQSPTVTPTASPTRSPTLSPTPVPTATPTRAPTGRGGRPPSIDDPILVGFGMHRGYGRIILTFDRLVEADTFDVSKFHLQAKKSLTVNASSPLYTKFTISFSNLDISLSKLSLQGNTTALEFYLDTTTYAQFVTKENVCKEKSSCFVRLDRGAVRSAIGFSSIAVNVSNAVQSTVFEVDKLPPFVVQYSVDMNLGYVTFLFSEPVVPSSFTAYGLTAQIASNVFTSGAFVDFRATGAYVVSSSNYDRNVTIALGVTNMNLIKIQTGLWADIDSTYLSGWKPFINDTAGNNPISLASFENLIGKKARSYNPDVTPPTLLYWNMNFNDGSISLFFSETVRVAFFNLSTITLRDTYQLRSNSSLYRIRDPAGVTTVNSNEYVIFFNSKQFNELKLLPGIGRLRNSSFLVLGYGAVVDTSANANVYQGVDATVSNPMKVNALILDTTPPQVTSISVDMSAKTFTVFFTEVVSRSSVNLGTVTFQSERATSVKVEAILLSDSLASLLSPTDGTSMTVQMKDTLFATFKRYNLLTKSRNTTFFANTKLFVTDVAVPANQIIALSTAFAKSISGYNADYVAPTLNSWYPHMGFGYLKMTFSEPMNQTTFNFNQITLHSEKIITPSTIVFTLESTSTLLSSDGFYSITVKMTEAGINQVKSNPPLCTSYTNCFLSLTRSFGTDTATLENSGTWIQNQIVAVASMQSSTNFIVDAISPTLSSFSINMNSGTLTLVFSEPVIFLDTTGITMYDDSFGTNSMTLSQFDIIEGYGNTTITIVLTRKDYIRLKEFAADSLVSSLLRIYSTAATDMAGNYITTSDILMATNYVADATVPAVAAIEYNHTYYNLTVYFNDLIIPSSVDLSSLNVVSLTGTRMELSEAAILTPANTYALVIQLKSMASTLLLNGVSHAQNSLSFYVNRAGAVVDYPARNTINRMIISNAVGIGNAPISFRLDMTVGTITLEFVHEITVSSIVASKFTLQATTSSTSYSFVSFNGTAMFDTHFLVITLSKTGYHAVQSLFTIASKEAIQLVVDKSAITDEHLRTLSSTRTVPCSAFTRDAVNPKLLSFAVNMGTGVMTLTFSEPVLTSSLKISSLTLASAQSNASLLIPISVSSVITATTNAAVISVSLNTGSYPNVREEMHLSKELGRSTSTTYLFGLSGWVSDTAVPPNYITAISVKSALQASVVTADAVAPLLLSTDIDLNAKVLYLYFDEAVNASSNKPSYYQLSQNTINIFGPQRSMAKSNTSFALSVGRTIAISITTTDFDAIMYQAPNLCSSAANCYLSFRAGAVRDISPASNKVDDVFFRYGVKVSKFTPDTTPPVVTAFDLSLQDGWVDFYFNEVILCTAPTLSNILFQPLVFNGLSSTFYRLSSTSTVTCALTYDKKMHVAFGLDNLIAIKAISGLLKTKSNTYMTLSTGAFRDASGTSSAAIPDGSAVNVRNFYPDTVSPVLQSFTVSAQRVLTLFFNEPVNAGTLIVSQIFVQDKVPTPVKTFSLSASSVSAIDAYKMSISLALNGDFSRINGNSDIFKTQLTTYLRISSTMIKDMSGNAIVSISAINALIMGPSIQSWDLDVDKNLIYLFFSENVDSKFSTLGFSIQTSATSSTYSKTLVANTGFAYSGSTLSLLVGSLATSDLNYLKYAGIARSAATAFLTVNFGVTFSLLTTTIVPNLKSTALRNTSALAVRVYNPDITPPKCNSYDLDLNNPATLTLRFNEPVLATSLVLTGLTLISKSVGSSSTLSNVDRAVANVNMTILVVTITESDLNRVKLAQKDGFLNGLLFARNGVTDYAGNYFVGNNEDSLIAIGMFVKDVTAPEVQYSILDLSRGIITLQFDEPIAASSLQPSDFYILSSANISTASYMILTNYTFIEADNTGLLKINLELYGVDFVTLRSNPEIGENRNNTYLGYKGVTDIFGNGNTYLKIRQVSDLVEDNTNVKLFSFDFEYAASGANNITFYFSKGVLLSQFNCSDFVLQTAANSFPDFEVRLPQTCKILTAGVNASSEVKVSVDSSYFDGILGTSPNVTWVTIPSVGSTADIYKNLLALTASPQKYIRLGPQLSKYLLDVNSGLLTLIFSQVIEREGPFDPTGIGFYAESTRSMFTLNSTTVLHPLFATSSANDSFAVINLLPNDLSTLKALDASSSQLYLFISSDYVLRGEAGHWLAPIPLARKFITAKYVADSSRPILKSLTLNMSYEYLYFVFDEPIRASSVVASNFRFQSMKIANGTSYKLLGGTISTSGNTMTLQLLRTDAAVIKLRDGLAKNNATSFISFTFRTLADYAGNFLSSVATTNAYHIDVFVPDTRGPFLMSFKLDMNSEILTFTFSEPVLASSINMTAITMQSRFFSPDGVRYRLTGGTVLDSDGLVISVKLDPKDVFNMKMIGGLVRSRQSTYIVMESVFCSDLANNSIVKIIDGKAQPAATYVFDLIRPFVRSIYLNIDEFYITFFMSEPMRLTEVDVTKVSVQLTSTNSTKIVHLSKFSYVDTSKLQISPNVRVEIAQVDMDIVKTRSPMFVNDSSTYFALEMTFAVDTSGNYVEEIPVTQARKATTFIADKTKPVLLTYTMDMNNQEMKIHFSEAVNPNSLNLSQLIIQNVTVRRFGVFKALTDSTPTFGEDSESTELHLLLSSDTVNFLKSVGICITSDHCYLTWSDAFIEDFAGNSIPPVWDGSVLGFVPMLPTKFVPDTTEPFLNRWFIDRTKMHLHMFFTESIDLVNSSSINLYLGTAARSAILTPQSIGKVLVSYRSLRTEAILELRDNCGGWSAMSSSDNLRSCPPHSLFWFIKQSPNKLFLTMSRGTFVDLSASKNPSLPVTSSIIKIEGTPDCSLCPEGYFVSKNCTVSSDRVCSKCSSCNSGSYTYSSCEQYQDTLCAECDVCSVGKYISAQCGNGHNTICSECTRCSNLEYESQECRLGLNTVCNSCKQCYFSDAVIRKRCDNDRYKWWAQANCCYDISGALTLCNNVERRNVMITARNGRHHWVFEETFPPIVGAEFKLPKDF